MDKKRGKGTVSLKSPMVFEGRMVLFLKGSIRVDYTAAFGNPYVLISDIEFIEQAKGKTAMVPMDNVSGIAWDEMLF